MIDILYLYIAIIYCHIIVLNRWLLEFDSFSINETKFKNNTNNRPLTESSVGQRPQWFKEMAQQRRSSDTFASVDNRTDLFSFNNIHHLDKNCFSRSARRSRSRAMEADKDEDCETNPNSKDNCAKTTPKEISDKFETIYETRTLKNGFKSCENLLFESNDSLSAESSDFIIPELPFGQFMVIEIMNNWGDDDFVGLNGIEIMDLSGTDLKIEKVCLIEDTLNLRSNFYRYGPNRRPNLYWRHCLTAFTELMTTHIFG